MAAYTTVESDDPAEINAQSLEFKSTTHGARPAFLGNEQANAQFNASNGTNRGYRSDQGSSSSFWNLDYFQKYFDVDTKTVLERCYMTLLPTTAQNYISHHLSPTPDLYGPFWTLTTLIFSLFVFSSLAHSITSYLSSSPIKYDFTLLSVAVSLVYAYGLAVPILLWLALRYLGVSDWSPVEAVAVWGYGQFVWIPVSLLCVIPVPLARWILVGVAFAVSGYFLVVNVYPILATAEAKAARLLVIVIALLHAGIALTFKILFFSYYVVDPLGPKDPAVIDPPSTGSNATMFM